MWCQVMLGSIRLLRLTTVVFAMAIGSGLLAVGESPTGWVYAQSGTPTSHSPEFDVVSVKPSGSDRVYLPAGGTVISHSSSFRYSSGRLSCNQALVRFIMEAYSVAKVWQISGPDWLNYEKYEFAATMPAETTKETARLMLRTMLADRFGLTLHREQRVMPVFALVVGSSGPRLHEVPNPGTYDGGEGPGHFTATAMPLQRLADHLTLIADRPVVDMTGIKGTYKIELKWTPDFADEQDARGRRDIGMLSVIEAQLGLKLQPRKMPFEILVIDHVEKKPTPN